MVRLIPGENQNIVKIDNTRNSKVCLENPLDKPLPCSGSVLETKGHNQVFVKSFVSAESCFPLISFSNAQEVADQRERVAVWFGDCIQTSIVHAKAKRTIGLFDKKDR